MNLDGFLDFFESLVKRSLHSLTVPRQAHFRFETEIGSGSESAKNNGKLPWKQCVSRYKDVSRGGIYCSWRGASVFFSEDGRVGITSHNVTRISHELWRHSQTQIQDNSTFVWRQLLRPSHESDHILLLHLNEGLQVGIISDVHMPSFDEFRLV